MERKSGILLHISSLPSSFGVGDLGPGAYQFADFLSSAGQHFWQILPINPTDSAYQDSPYSSISALAANTLFISPQLLLEDQLLSKEDVNVTQPFLEIKVDYIRAKKLKGILLQKAFENFTRNQSGLTNEFGLFKEKHGVWLSNYALFVVIKKRLGGEVWDLWPKHLKLRDSQELQRFRSLHAQELLYEQFLQFLFFRQWTRLREYCRGKNIQFIGDIPIYVSFDSEDVWSHPELFKLKEDLSPMTVAGVPPDYFSKTGQRWGNPIYNWEKMKQTRYQWWINRLKMNFQLFDSLRIDHFRGLVQYWEIPAYEETAVNGQWSDVPTDDFFTTLQKNISPLTVIAEDLGTITDDVKDVMKRYGLPGMKILLFAFNGDMKLHPYLPHNYDANCVVYTGTHDNNTALGWYETEASPEEKKNFLQYIAKTEINPHEVPWAFIDIALKSKANLAITPLQDILSLGQDARMNTPATLKDNWQWRYNAHQLTPALSQRLYDLTKKSQRL